LERTKTEGQETAPSGGLTTVIATVFADIDMNGDGFISHEELLDFAKSNGVSNEDAESMFDVADSSYGNDDGEISFEQFRRVMTDARTNAASAAWNRLYTRYSTGENEQASSARDAMRRRATRTRATTRSKNSKKAAASSEGIESELEEVLTRIEMKGELFEAVAEQGCETLNAMSQEDGNNDIIGEGGGIQLLCLMMKTHGESNAKVAFHACQALRNLAWEKHRENQRITGESGGIRLIVEMMEAHIDLNEPAVVREGCAALDNLIDGNDDNKIIVGESGGVSAIIKMMVKHASGRRGNKEAAENGCSVLCRLADNAVNKRMILQQNGDAVLEEIQSKWKRDRDLQKDVRDALGKLHA
jgi:hypothetical protein